MSDVPTFWQKAAAGLAKLPATDVQTRALYTDFWALPPLLQEKASKSADYAGYQTVSLFASSEQKAADQTRRDMFRAYTAALTVAEYQEGSTGTSVAPATGSALSKSSASDAVREQLKSLITAMYPLAQAGGDTVARTVAVDGGRTLLLVTPTTPTSDAVTRFEKAAGPGIRNFQRLARMAMPGNYAVARMQGAVRGSVTTIASAREQYKGIGDVWATEWLSGRRVLDAKVQEGLNDMAINSQLMFDAIGEAYGHFSTNVTESQQIVAGNLDLLKTVFTSLKTYLPPPANLIGTVGEGILSGVKVELHLDNRSAPVADPNSSKLVASVTALAAKADTARTAGAKLKGLPTTTEVKNTFQNVVDENRKQTKEICDFAIDQYFGADGNASETMSNFVGKYFREHEVALAFETMANSSVRGKTGVKTAAQEDMQRRFALAVQAYGKECGNALAGAIKWPGARGQDTFKDLVSAVELHFTCQYIQALWGQGDYSGRGLGPGFINLLDANNVIKLNTTHEASDARGVLNWKGGTDHKKTLLLFANWYVENIDPFLVALPAIYEQGGQSGRWSLSMIQQRCKEHIGIINASINAGRTKSWRGSTWNWTLITNAYTSKTGRKAATAIA